MQIGPVEVEVLH